MNMRWSPTFPEEAYHKLAKLQTSRKLAYTPGRLFLYALLNDSHIPCRLQTLLREVLQNFHAIFIYADSITVHEIAKLSHTEIKLLHTSSSVYPMFHTEGQGTWDFPPLTSAIYLYYSSIPKALCFLPCHLKYYDSLVSIITKEHHQNVHSHWFYQN